MVIQAQLKYRRQSQAQRQNVRRKMRLNVSGKTRDGQANQVLIHDLSTSGILVQSEEALAIGEIIEVELPRTGLRHIEVVWGSGNYFGCRFLEPVSPAAVSAALLSAEPERPSKAAASEESRTPVGSLGERLATLRDERGWSIETLAERLGVSRQAVWYWETGQRLPRAKHFAKMIEALGLQEQDLLAPPPDPANGGSDDLVDQLKREVARRNGVDESRVRIVIEL
jgi:transcriptional regulator with XRE-family HTH domain